jgi:hypothetical protein
MNRCCLKNALKFGSSMLRTRAFSFTHRAPKLCAHDKFLIARDLTTGAFCDVWILDCQNKRESIWYGAVRHSYTSALIAS